MKSQRIVLKLFGLPSLRVSDTSLDVAATRDMAVLIAYLALHDVVHRSDLAEAVWPDEPRSRGLERLRTHAVRLRRLLAEAGLPVTLSAGRSRLGFIPEGAIDVDVRLFVAALEAGDPATAVGLYSGDFLARFDQPWVVATRDRLRLQQVAGLTELVERDRAERPIAAVHWLRLLQALDPYRETSAVELARLRERLGDRIGALSELERFERFCRTELDVEPSATVRELAAGLRSGRAQPHVEPLPAESNALIGRTRELTEVRTLTQCGSVVVICGAPGIGKSRLALRLAHAVRAAGEADVVFRDLRHTPNPELPGAAGTDVRPRRRLLIFDHADAAVASLRTLVASIDRTSDTVVAVSRAPLGLPSESAYRVGPLALVDAIALMRARAGPALDEDVARRICVRYSGVPLALEIAAENVALFGAAAVDAGEVAINASEALQRSFDDAVAALSPSDVQALSRLAVFPSAFVARDATVVLECADEAATDTLRRLHRSSLLEADAPAGRFRLLASIRSFAAARAGAGERRRAARSFATAVGARFTPMRPAALAAADADDALTVDAALDVFLRDGFDVERGLALLDAVAPAYAEQGRWRALLAHATSVSDVGPTERQRGALMRHAAIAARNLRDVDGSIRWARSALEAFTRAGDEAAAARTAVTLVNAYLAADRLDEADEALADATRLAHAAGDRRAVMLRLFCAGQLSALRGEFVRAHDAYARGYAIAIELDGESHALIALENLAYCDIELGRYESAELLIDDAVHRSAASNLTRNLCWALHRRATLTLRRGDLSAAIDAIGRCDEIARVIGEPLVRIRTLEEIVDALADRDPAVAAQLTGAIESARARFNAPYHRFERTTAQQRFARIARGRSGDAVALRVTGAARPLDAALEHAVTALRYCASGSSTATT